MQQAQQHMVTVAQSLSIRQELRPKGFIKDKFQERPQLKVTKPEPTDFSTVL